MKQFLRFAALVACACLFAGCGSSPESVALNFSEAMAKGKYDVAEKYASSDTVKLVKLTASLAEDSDKKPNAKFKVVSSSIDDDTATVTLKVTDDGESKEEEIFLRKIDGKWKVDMKK